MFFASAGTGLERWSLFLFCRVGVSYELVDAVGSNSVKGRNMGRRRGRGRNSNHHNIKVLDVEMMAGNGGSPNRLSNQMDDGFKGCEMVSVIEMVEEAIRSGVCPVHLGCSDVALSFLQCNSACLSSEKLNTSHGDVSDEAIDDAIVQDASYLPGLDDSVALRCLAFLPWMHHWKLAMLSRRHRDLVRNSLLFKLRQEYCSFERWICIYTSGNNRWTAFDPKHNMWRNLPHADVSPNFDLSDKESLSAGTHLMWLGREAFDFACYRYDLVANGWEKGPPMVNPRCLFASATSERYDSLKGIWEPLPNMAIPRHKCSGFFMDGKFYVIGGNTKNHEPLMSGEEFDPEKNSWRTIENMYCTPDTLRSANASPPLVAVARNELYAIESSSNLLKVYEKQKNIWKVLGRVPVRADFCNGWGLAFKALGDELFVIGGHRISTQEHEGVAVFSWRPMPGATYPDWRLVNSRETGIGNFLFNCAVMAC